MDVANGDGLGVGSIGVAVRGGQTAFVHRLRRVGSAVATGRPRYLIPLSRRSFALRPSGPKQDRFGAPRVGIPDFLSQGDVLGP